MRNFPGDLSSAGFVYNGSGSIENLNDLLLDPGHGWTITEATAINDRGQIAAEAYQQESGENQVVLLTPSPEPSSLSLVIVAAFGLLAIKSGRFWTRMRGHG